MSGRWAYGRLADYVDRVLKGVDQSQLPIEQTTTVSLAVNLKTAKAPVLSYHGAVLLRADHVLD